MYYIRPLRLWFKVEIVSLFKWIFFKIVKSHAIVGLAHETLILMAYANRQGQIQDF